MSSTRATPPARPGTAPAPPTGPAPLTGPELAAVLRLLSRPRPRVRSIVLGSSRDAVSRRTADTIARAWTDRDGDVFDVLDWPEQAASWLRQARRFTATMPDAWVVTGTVPGWAAMGRRLAVSTDWDPARTIATAALADATLIADNGRGTFNGLRGARRDGGTWELTRNLLAHHVPSHDGAHCADPAPPRTRSPGEHT